MAKHHTSKKMIKGRRNRNNGFHKPKKRQSYAEDKYLSDWY